MKMFCFVILLLFLKGVTAQSTHDKLKEAKDYLTVNPAHSKFFRQYLISTRCQ
ncbi:hypothetical protein J8L98_00065 [Pseudoalteromonas sp. MMG013]|uniref:hypothetical protein n=1 Tax=unclassified Pseudoalteromonas TaxID=194690 RepID=UPI001B36E8A6|nr:MULTISPECIES: hypothetical protein [unclassified Pseudoalteromonas]MBQ4848240.1 hypothetical protein [Pseudoalteromonas sp. MMG005]MBQ4860082.1 hypothetical protein [Pseudoalteromonas sp. MMG013]